MANIDGFDANNYEPSGQWSPLPAGEYVVIAKNSEWKDTERGDGSYLQFDLEVVEGEHKGEPLTDRLNLKNNSSKAVEIANGTLSSICRAVGVMRPRDTVELHNKPMVVKVAVEKFTKRDGNEGMSNKIKSYKAPGTTSAQPSNGNGGAKPPWSK